MFSVKIHSFDCDSRGLSIEQEYRLLNDSSVLLARYLQAAVPLRIAVIYRVL